MQVHIHINPYRAYDSYINTVNIDRDTETESIRGVSEEMRGGEAISIYKLQQFHPKSHWPIPLGPGYFICSSL